MAGKTTHNSGGGVLLTGVVLATTLWASAWSIAGAPVLRAKLVDPCQLKGKVQVVKAFGDYKVEVVSSFPDLKVKKVSALANDPGEWQFVTSLGDFKVEFVDNFGDFKIQYVDAFPGCK